MVRDSRWQVMAGEKAIKWWSDTRRGVTERDELPHDLVNIRSRVGGREGTAGSRVLWSDQSLSCL